MIELLHNPPRFLFLTGKGGVGKTSIACASRGRPRPPRQPGPAGLHRPGLERRPGLRPARSGTRSPRSRRVQGSTHWRSTPRTPRRSTASAPSPRFGTFCRRRTSPTSPNSCPGPAPPRSPRSTSSPASSQATTSTRDYDHVVFDTAPTGHTVRLLKLPGEWTYFLEDGLGDASCLGPMAGLDKTRTTYADALAALADPASDTTWPGCPPTNLVAGRGVPHRRRTCRSRRQRHPPGRQRHPSQRRRSPTPSPTRSAPRRQPPSPTMPANLAGLVIDRLPLRSRDVMGLDALTTLLSETADQAQRRRTATPSAPVARGP